MKKITYLSIIFCLTFFGLTGLVFSVRTAQAVELDDLIAIFTPNPLFGAVNFVPGQSVSGSIEIKNKSGVTKTIITEAIKEDDPNNFAAALNLEIKQGETNLYGLGDSKTLKDFFDAGEVVLSTLANDATTTYEFIATFKSDAGDEYQNKKINNFDILIGFQGEEGTTGGGGTGGGGSGGGGSTSGLTISQTANTVVSPTSVTITWLTSYNSTSRVIYAAEGEAHIFDLSAVPISPSTLSNYGYQYSSDEIDTPAILNGKTFHTVILTGLTPGTTYYYRVISHASPDTVGQELSFTTTGTKPSEQTIGPNEGGLVAGQETGGGAVAGEETGPAAGPDAGGSITSGGASATGNVVAGAETTGGEEIPNEMVLGVKVECPAATWWQWLLAVLLLIGINFIYYFIFRKKLNIEN